MCKEVDNTEKEEKQNNSSIPDPEKDKKQEGLESEVKNGDEKRVEGENPENPTSPKKPMVDIEKLKSLEEVYYSYSTSSEYYSSSISTTTSLDSTDSDSALP